eukprot:TRINITY_DN11541_c0_g1_i1.p1 TRINITY_DN11541_c0_g1~~TRINITY_DN11541_c0_g1_i1.p1  ORF type:complete len:202 (+),score=53.81 TRINITY_DN11541_c0_g1_i1:23-628(+)
MTSFRALLVLCFLSLVLVSEARSPNRMRAKNVRNVAQTTPSTIIIDDFSSSQRFTNNENSLLGYASDDGSCGASWSAGGLLLSNTSTSCYYYTVFPANTCYSLPSESNLRITFASASTSFAVALQDRDTNCSRRQSTFYVSSSSFTLFPSPVSSSLSYIDIPLVRFSAGGISLGRLHGILFDSFSSSITPYSALILSLIHI